MRLILALLLLLALPAAAHAAAPAATTGAAADVTRATAALTGRVDPHGVATSYRFEYGTTSAYGLVSADGDAGAGEGAQSVRTGVAGLSPGTTYHFRLVATSADGAAEGADRTFRTAPAPRLPGLSSTAARDVGPTAATLRSRVDPNRGETTYHFEYGLSQSYGSRTPERSAGAGDARVDVAERIEGLRPYRRYHFRVVATNEAGRTVTRNRTFTTSRLPTAITLSLDAPRAPWGEGVEVFGRVSGTGVNGIPVALERQDFPFLGPFSSIGAPASVRADRFGRFRFFVPSLFSATRLHALTRTAVGVTSPAVTAAVAVRFGTAIRRASRRAVRIRGSVRPAAPEGRAVLQRRTARGGWSFVRGTGLRPVGSNRSRYSFRVAKRPGKRRYRVRVYPRDGGAHVTGTSRTVTVSARAAR